MQTITSTQHLCYNCFQERETLDGPCPFCGFDLEANVQDFPVALRAGTVLHDRYIVGRALGQGGFGITYLALDTQLQARVAVKEFMPSDIATRTDVTTVSVMMEGKEDEFTYGAERFQEEARTLAKFIGNPNIAGVSSYFDENGTSYFVMDYIEGISFKSYIANMGGKVSIDDALNVMIPVLRALTAVHAEGFIHRDVTPDNIYISKDGNVKLLDFGSARYSIGDKSKSLDVVLKVGYAPKEQYIRRGRQGPYTDVYSCAACLYAAITGYLPPESLERLDQDTLQPISTLGIDIPAYLDNAILKGLAVQPEDRFQSAAEFLDAIETQTVVEVPAERTQQSPAEPAKKKVRPTMLAGIAAAVLAVVVGIGAMGGGGGSSGETGAGTEKPHSESNRDDRPLIKAEVPSITIQGEEFSTDLRELDLSNRSLTDADIQDLKYMVNLERLSMYGNDISDVSPLAGLTRMRNLNIGGGSVVPDLLPLAGLTELVQLYCGGDYQSVSEIHDLRWAAGLTKLENLDLRVGSLTSLAGLEGLTNLKTLSLSGSDMALTDLSPLNGLTNLTRLYITRNGSGNGAEPLVMEDLTAFSSLTNLQELYLGVDGLVSMDGLEGMTQMRSLHIFSTSIPGYGTVRDVSALANMTQLKTAYLYIDPAADLAPLSNLSSLQELYIMLLNDHLTDGEKIFTDLSFLSGMTALRDLNVQGFFGDLAPLASPPNLTKLELRDSFYDEQTLDLSPLANLTNVQDLNISSYRVRDVSPVGSMTGLRTLSLSCGGNRNPVTDISALANLKDLVSADLNFQGGVTDWSPVDHVPSVRKN